MPRGTRLDTPTADAEANTVLAPSDAAAHCVQRDVPCRAAATALHSRPMHADLTWRHVKECAGSVQEIAKHEIVQLRRRLQAN